jgi:hypothetical protein
MKQQITILAKTYPELSKRHGALICTAGINDSGDLVRLYPVPWDFFFKNKKTGFAKWDIIEVEMEKSAEGWDHRKESYKIDHHTIKVVGHIGTGKDRKWSERMKFIRPISKNLCEVQRNQKNGESDTLAIIKPIPNLQFKVRPRRDIGSKAEEICLEGTDRFDSEIRGYCRPEKLPWIGADFKCFDPFCKGHKTMFLDWEVQELYRRLKEDKTKQKIDSFNEKDLYLMMGTIYRHPYSWVEISTFYPPKPFY